MTSRSDLIELASDSDLIPTEPQIAAFMRIVGCEDREVAIASIQVLAAAGFWDQ